MKRIAGWPVLGEDLILQIWGRIMNHETVMFGELESRRFQVLMAVSVKMRAFWDISPYSLVGVVRS
jgi:hypothetical protein